MTAIEPALPHYADRAVTQLSKAAQTRVQEALRSAKSDSTRRNYQRDWDRFTAWCGQRQHQALPAAGEVVADYLTEHAGTITPAGERAFALSTLRRWVASINYVHRATANTISDSQVVKDTLSGLTRMYARTLPRTVKQKDPLLLEPLRDIVDTARSEADTWRKRLRERRDTAILLIGWTAALRRSEVVGINIGDIAARTETRYRAAGEEIDVVGYELNVRISKTDQYGHGELKVLPIGSSLASCAPCAYLRWLEVVLTHDRPTSADGQILGGRQGIIALLGRAPGVPGEHICAQGLAHFTIPDPNALLFRSITRNGLLSDAAPDAAVVHHVVQDRAIAAGWDEKTAKGLGGHSLRAGFVTEGVNQDKSMHAIKRQTGHKSMTNLQRYARHKDAWEHNAATDLGM